MAGVEASVPASDATPPPVPSPGPPNKPNPQIVTRSKDTRQPAEQHLKNLLDNVAAETDQERLRLHDPGLERALEELCTAHTTFLTTNNLDGTQPPHSEYIPNWKAKQLRIVDKQRHKLFQGPEGPPRSGNLEATDDSLSVVSLSSRFSTISTTSTGMAGIHKLGQYRKRINSIVQAVSTALSKPNLPSSALTLIQKQWEPVDRLLDDHTMVLDGVVQLLGESDPRLIEEIPLTNRMVDLVEKARHDLTAAHCQASSPTALPSQPQPSPNLSQMLDPTDTTLNRGFIDPSTSQVRNTLLPPATWANYGPGSNVRKTTPQHQQIPYQQKQEQPRCNHLDASMYNPNDVGYTEASTGARSKSHLKLPTTKPPYFNGELLHYLPWRRLWRETMGKGYPGAVQLAQLKESLATRVQEIIPLATLRTMTDFWALMDDEYVNFHELARKAVHDIKSVNRKDTRYIQIIRNKLLTYKVDLEQVQLQHRVTSDVMITEHWLPLLPPEIRERWIQDNTLEGGPLWPVFEQFINKQAAAARQRDRMSEASSANAGSATSDKPCSKCLSKAHKTKDCKTIYCARCIAWHLPGKHTSSPTKESYCRGCESVHKFGVHTRQKHDVNLSSAHTCKRCSHHQNPGSHLWSMWHSGPAWYQSTLLRPL